MKRRTFIALSTTAFATLTIPACNNFGPLEYDPMIAEPEALSLIWDNENIIKIGEMFREHFPKEVGERKLVKLISNGLSLDKSSPGKSLLLQIGQEYTTGRIVMLDGWLLSITEARQCALFSLIQPK
jgi:hypothetical protein